MKNDDRNSMIVMILSILGGLIVITGAAIVIYRFVCSKYRGCGCICDCDEDCDCGCMDGSSDCNCGEDDYIFEKE